MNKEAVPLLIAILIPCIFVFLIFIYFYGYDITLYFRKIDLIYYIIVIPFILGLLAAVLKLKKD